MRTHEAPPPTQNAGPVQRGARAQTRISLVLVALAALIAGGMVALQIGQARQLTSVVDNHTASVERTLARITDLRASGARIHADDYSRWDDFVEFVRRPDSEWQRINLTDALATFDLDAAWVFDDRFNHLCTANPTDDPLFEDLPAPAPDLARRLTQAPVGHFFTVTRRGILEVWTSSIQPSDDFERQTPARGYYVVGRLWTAERMAELASAMGGEVLVVPAKGLQPGASGSTESGRIEVRTAFMGIDDRPVAGLVYSTDFQVVPKVRFALWMLSLLALMGAVASLVCMWIALTHWVGRPLALITEAMNRGDDAPLGSLRNRHDELGQIAMLVEESFAQRRALVEAREAAEAATVAKSNFLASISHELRTPMHGILSFSRFGLRDAETAPRDELRDSFSQISECGESLLTLLNALLDLSKLEAGRMVFSFSEVYLPDVVDVAIDEFRSLFRDRAVELRAEVETGLPPVVADKGRLLQVVRNLISNAVKFTPADGTVVIRVASSGASQRIVVEDSGVGIPAGEEDLIFQKFTQASHTSSRTGSTGLGLAISREIIEAHEGRIWAENRAGGGARLICEVPVEGPAAAQEPSENGASSPRAEEDARIAAPTPASDANNQWRKAA